LVFYCGKLCEKFTPKIPEFTIKDHFQGYNSIITVKQELKVVVENFVEKTFSYSKTKWEKYKISFFLTLCISGI